MTDSRFIELNNDGWGFESNCFVCEPRNDAGLRIPFRHDTVDQVVTAEFELDDRFSGSPRYIHGGVALAILDEAMAWATIAIAEKFAVTTHTSTTFERPIKVGVAHTVTARITGIEGRVISTTSTIARHDGKPCATATATFTALDLGQASAAAGGALTEAETPYTNVDDGQS